MTGNNFAEIIKSPAFTILIATGSLLILMRQVPKMVALIKAANKED
jgi:hypothetical protein